MIKRLKKSSNDVGLHPCTPGSHRCVGPRPGNCWRRCAVGATDKARNKAEEVKGKAKEAVGRATGDRKTSNRGKGDQAKSNLKDAGEKVKDAVRKR